MFQELLDSVLKLSISEKLQVLFLCNPRLCRWGFHLQLMRSRAWSKVGDPAIVKVHTQKGVDISIVGCISPFDTICFSKVEHLKKKKKNDAALIKKESPESSPSKKKEKLVIKVNRNQSSLKKTQRLIILSNLWNQWWIFWINTAKKRCLLLWTTVKFITLILLWMPSTNVAINHYLCHRTRSFWIPSKNVDPKLKEYKKKPTSQIRHAYTTYC